MNNTQLTNTVLLSLALGASSSLWAGDIADPFASSNRNPFVQIYGLQAVQSGQLTQAGEFDLALQLDIANSFAMDNKGSENIVIDGETHRANLQFRYGIASGVELGLDVPYLSHERGGLDGFIDSWHEFWGFPDGGRPQHPKDQLNFSYQKYGRQLSGVSESESGVGDVSFSLGYELASSESRQWALRSAIKLPTGDAAALLGSESTDISLGINVSDQGLLQQYNMVLHGSAGVLWMDGGEVLEELREDWVVYGSSTLSWLATDSLSLKIQLDAHSAFYDSAVKPLGGDSAQIIVGGAIRLSEKWLLDLAVSEDIVVDTAPDVVFHIGIKALGF